MRAEVKVLINGYVKGNLVEPTTTLIIDGKNLIVVDPGMGKGKVSRLENALKEEKLTFDDITHVFTTHYHLDHTQFVGLFSNAKLVDYLYIYDGEKWIDHDGDNFKISPNVEIVHTPGHAIEHASLKVDTKDGVVVVAGDVWWFSDKTPRIDEMAWDQKKLEKSRKKILKIADFIIPGHGAMFRNTNPS